MLAGGQARVAEVAQGLALRAYAFDTYRTPEKDAPEPNRAVSFEVRDPAAAEAAFAPLAAQAEGVCFARDLVSEPANVLGTVEFANRLVGLKELGVEVEVLDEPELEALGMRTLLAVGQGSESPSKVVVMQWKGGGEEAPFALVGKGVVFDTGGISIKPGAGMEEMTMDMGGAAVVAGVMRTLALRKAPANVVGLVGLVENMPDGKAQRPGDVVRSMKGDTDRGDQHRRRGAARAGRRALVRAGALQAARAMVDLATLTGRHHRRPRPRDGRRLRERRQAGRGLPRRRRGRGRGRLADAARARLRQAHQEPHRRHGERRRPCRRGR